MIAGLILAAGESSRMGRDKALLLYRGQTFLDTIVSTLRAGGIGHIIVVLGHHADEIRKEARLEGAEVVVNAQYQLGQTSSLKAGLAALGDPEIEAVLLCLVDHPAVRSGTVRAMIEAFRPHHPAVIIPSYRGQRGHPVLLSRRLFADLLALTPDVGANSVIRRQGGATRIIKLDDLGVVSDIDDLKSYLDLERT